VLILITLSIAGAAGAPADRKPGTLRTDARGIEQVWVPAGSFQQGTADTTGLAPPAWGRGELATEQPRHRVTLTRGFWIDRTEVTHAAHAVFVKAGGYADSTWWSPEGWAWRKTQGDDVPVTCGEPLPDHPRLCVTWYEAEAYAAWRGGRLPTESEWEFAARGPDSRIYPWGDTFDPERAHVVDTEGPARVGSYPEGASWVGALDMAGNVMEWVEDWLSSDYYAARVEIDPPGAAEGRIKIEKGGWWGSNPFVARAAYRHFEDPPHYQDHHIGFRIVTPEATTP
jgi:formylglycine-generating enzyme required for sulfatase activity